MYTDYAKAFAILLNFSNFCIENSTEEMKQKASGKRALHANRQPRRDRG